MLKPVGHQQQITRLRCLGAAGLDKGRTSMSCLMLYTRSIWPMCVLRADTLPITSGAYSNVQDGCIIHRETGAQRPGPAASASKPG